MEIEIASDHCEGEEFVAWLTSQGHDAELGRSTGSYVDREWTSHSGSANRELSQLWTDYCHDGAQEIE